MMKIRGVIRDREVLIVGLSHGNLDRLREQGLEGRIEIKGSEVGLPVDILITAAPTEMDMLEAFQAGIREGTRLHIDKKLKS